MPIQQTSVAKAVIIALGLSAVSVQADEDSFPNTYPAFWKEWQMRPYGEAWQAARDQEKAAREQAKLAELAGEHQHAHPHGAAAPAKGAAPFTAPHAPAAHGNAAFADELARMQGGPRSSGDHSHVTPEHAAAHPEHQVQKHVPAQAANANAANNYNVADEAKYHECAALLQQSASRVDSIESRLLAGAGYTEVRPADSAPAVVTQSSSHAANNSHDPNALPLAETFPVAAGQVVVEEPAGSMYANPELSHAVDLGTNDFGSGSVTSAGFSTNHVVGNMRATTDRIDYPDGSFYRGDISAERRHGYGVMTWPDGTRYLGQFFNDQYHGHGQLKWSDGTSYTGSFLHDQLEGRGTIVWQDGLKFQGEMETNQRHGKGTYTLPDGRRVVGVFTNDRPAGTGILIYPDGRHEPVHFGKDVNIKHNPLKFCNYASMPGCP